jgi:glutamate/tyrosine decarboxylase-like PLP-dependent enzyme
MDHLDHATWQEPAHDAGAGVLARAHVHAAAFLRGLPERPVAARADAATLRERLCGTLPEGPSDPAAVIDQLAQDVQDGLLGSPSGRFFGWVIGGTLPVAIAADWLTAAWDQNAAAYALSPAAAVIEEACGAWLKELLGLPAGASFALVTGCQMAHVTALAAARHKLLAARGVDVEQDGLCGAPRLRVLTSPSRHESVLRAVRLLGLGAGCVAIVPADESGRLRMDQLAQVLHPDQPTILLLQAGDLDTGSYDPFAEACRLAHAAGAWVHVDGAFGLWAAASPAHRHLLRGVERADSWATDGHKWLNLPYDVGFVFVADPAAHRASFAQATAYAQLVTDTRRQLEWNPEWSRRARGFAVYAAIRALGRQGIADMIGRSCAHAAALVDGLGRLPGVELLARPVINQGLVRFLDRGGDHDARTDAVVQAVQRSGGAWFGATTWRGMRAMRVSVCNWRTSDDDVASSIEAVREAMQHSVRGA